MLPSPNSDVNDYDVVIIGGAFSGSAMGILLKRANPDLRVLIVEKSKAFDRKVGESTSEVAGCFLTRVLGVTQHLAREQVVKHGLRLWFNDSTNTCFGRCSEVGSRYQVRLPTYQLDRSTFDLYLLNLAVEEGCELWRPANVRELELNGVGNQRLTVKLESGEVRAVKARWVVDASGKAAFLARRHGTLEMPSGHPTNSLWARFSHCGDLDSYALKERYPEYADAVHCSRGAATNHLMGRGWWCWIIPLKNGDISAGITWDTTLFTLPGGGNLGERLHRHLVSHPVGREIFGEARPVEKDVRMYSGLPYYCREPIGDGWVIVGDASGFMDPLYSQGLDYCSHTVYATHHLILKSLAGECVKKDAEAYREEFVLSYHRWFYALYHDKYRYLGDAELMYAAFILDIASYFLGPVRFVYRDPDEQFRELPYRGFAGGVFSRFMRFYNYRLGRLADHRFACGTYGDRNLDRRYLLCQGFVPEKSVYKQFIKGIRQWISCEVRTLVMRIKYSRQMKNDKIVIPEPQEVENRI